MQILELVEGETINEVGENVSNFSFSNSDFSFNETTTEVVIVNKMQETSSLDLFRCLNNLLKLNLNLLKIEDSFSKHNCTIEALENIYKEIYKRIFIPFFIPLLILISQLTIMTNKENSNYTKYKTLIFLIGLAVIIFSETTLKFINANIIDNLIIIIIPFVLICILYIFLAYYFKFRYKRENYL